MKRFIAELPKPVRKKKEMKSSAKRQTYSRIVSRGDSTVNKRTAMFFCIGLKLDMKEAELFLMMSIAD